MAHAAFRLAALNASVMDGSPDLGDVLFQSFSAQLRGGKAALCGFHGPGVTAASTAVGESVLSLGGAMSDAMVVGESVGVTSPLVYSGVTIRDRGEMLSLTDMWRAAGAEPSQQPAKWREHEGTKDFVSHIASVLLIGEDGCFQTLRGTEAGTWAHWQIAFAYAKYLSPEFHAWCNSVVRSHIEGRNVSVYAAPAVAGLTRQDLQQFAQIVGDASGRAAAERCVELMDNRVRDALVPVEERLIALERAQVRRRALSEATRRDHLEDTRALGGRCPCCNLADVVTPDAARAPFTEFDHFYANSHPGGAHTWLICKPCHTELTTGRVPREQREAEFRAYQNKRRRLPGRQQTLFG